MAYQFRLGYFGTANGVKLPSWVFRKAKAYVRSHPSAAPCKFRPSGCRVAPGSRELQRSWPWDWGWLKWTARALNTARCISGPAGNVSWFFGCRDIPNWSKAYRKVMVKCEGTVILVPMFRGGFRAIGSAASACFWGVLSSHIG